MSERQEVGSGSLATLDAIRARFEALQRSSSKGFHALGEEVLSAYFKAKEQLPKPVSAMTFRNFLQGKTTLRDPTGLELYFRALGASDAEMRAIRATLQQEADRRLVAPRAQATLKAFDELDIVNMPYSRALVECEVVTRLEGSISAPVTHLTPREYLCGPDGLPDAGPDPERWGLLQHLDDLSRYMAKLDKALTDGLEAIPRNAYKKRRVQAAADLREAASAYANWLLYRPRGGDLFFSRRRFMLHGYVPEAERQVAVARSKRVARLVFGFMERFVLELCVPVNGSADFLHTPRAENALEVVAERVLAIVNSFYVTVVRGACGPGGMFYAAYQLRHNNQREPGGTAAVHDALTRSYSDAVQEGNRKLEEDVRVPYGNLRQVYDEQFRTARPLMFDIWQRDYAGSIVRQSLSILLSELHQHKIIDDKRFLELTKELCVGKEAAQLFNAAHPAPLYERLDL